MAIDGAIISPSSLFIRFSLVARSVTDATTSNSFPAML
jgi:hypothetical protein